MRNLEPVRGPVCGIFAAALAADVDFPVAMEAARKALKPHPSWRGRMSIAGFLNVLDQLAIPAQVRPQPARPTVAKLAATIDSSQHYIVRIRGHLMTLEGGKLYDQTTPQGDPVQCSRHRRKRVTHIIAIN